MASFEWLSKPSSNFGNAWVPIAIMQLQSSRGRYRSFQGILDSGSVVTLLRKSAADELGLTWDAGRPISLTNVGGGQTEAYVHELNMRFSADETSVLAPVAIAASERVPILIGRLGVFDRFEITIDPTRRETRIELR